MADVRNAGRVAPTVPVGAYAPPDLAKVRSWTGVNVSSIDDAALQVVIDAEVWSQAQVCTVDPYTPNLYQAVLRRCARELAARGVPLGGMTAEAEYGPAQLATFDAEVERLEGPSRIAVTG